MDYTKILSQYTQLQKNIQENEKKPGECEHTNYVEKSGISICVECGIEKPQKISSGKDWFYYGRFDSKHRSDPNRCHLRKVQKKDIYKDVAGMGFSDKIITTANILYKDITKFWICSGCEYQNFMNLKKCKKCATLYADTCKIKQKIYRGNSRKSMVFACIYNAYKISDNPQSCDSLIKIFNLQKNIGLNGLKYVNLHASSETLKKLKQKKYYITPLHIIKEIMKKFKATTFQIEDVLKIYEQIKNRSHILNRSRPQSVASGVVYYYILAYNKDISIKEFCGVVDLSALTITRIVKEICKILKTDHIVIK